MRFEPSFVRELSQEFKNVDPKIREKVARHHSLSEKKLMALLGQPQIDIAGDECEHASEKDVTLYDDIDSQASAIQAMKNGEVAFVVLAGDDDGSGLWRMPNLGISLMGNKVFQSGFVAEGGAHEAPVWLMVSPKYLQQFIAHTRDFAMPGPKSMFTFKQFQSYRLRPDNKLDKVDNVPQLYSTGTGDLGPTLSEHDSYALYPTVKYCVIVNCNNVLATLNPFILAKHIDSHAQVTCEVVRRQEGDKGSVPIWYNNSLQLVQQTYLSDETLKTAPFHSTNSMIINVDVLRSDVPWAWHRVRRHSDNRIVVQYERLLQQYTELFRAHYVLVDRGSRYFPVRTKDDLPAADKILNGNK